MRWLICLLMVSNSYAHHQITQNEKECMTLAVYHEGRGEPEYGQYAIMDVIKNRSDSRLFPKHNICDVIKRNKQFSFYNNGWIPMKNTKVANDIKNRVELFYNGLNVGITRGALWYHHQNIKPIWAKSKEINLKIGNHVFLGSGTY